MNNYSLSKTVYFLFRKQGILVLLVDFSSLNQSVFMSHVDLHTKFQQESDQVFFPFVFNY